MWRPGTAPSYRDISGHARKVADGRAAAAAGGATVDAQQAFERRKQARSDPTGGPSPYRADASTTGQQLDAATAEARRQRFASRHPDDAPDRSDVPRSEPSVGGIYAQQRQATTERKAAFMSWLRSREDVSSVELTKEDEASAFSDYPSEGAFHEANPQTVRVPAASALGQMLTKKPYLESRKGCNTWNTLPRADDDGAEDAVRAQSTDEEWYRSDAFYNSDFRRTNAEHQAEAVQYSVSIYTKRKLVIDDLYSYHEMITRREEKDIAGELVTLLHDERSVDFHPEEGRYCVNLHDKQMVLPVRDKATGVKLHPIIFSLATHAPTLARVLHRFYKLGLVPAVPNTVQVSEYVSPYGGYAPQRKHPSIGPYLGVLGLVSQSLMALRHVDQPWLPQIMAVPRSLHVCGQQVLNEYRIGYPQTHSNTHTFQGASRHTKDYRIEVLFATVDSRTLPAMRDVQRLSDYAETRIMGAKALPERAFTANKRPVPPPTRTALGGQDLMVR